MCWASIYRPVYTGGYNNATPNGVMGCHIADSAKCDIDKARTRQIHYVGKSGYGGDVVYLFKGMKLDNLLLFYSFHLFNL